MLQDLQNMFQIKQATYGNGQFVSETEIVKEKKKKEAEALVQHKDQQNNLNRTM